ncbi:Crp/Fnr family transcriptional regulator [candidate division KSB1 bacterium]|nr:Crp/Fnr family transcriptional regulator [candidate division KSB1 bacterium]
MESVETMVQTDHVHRADPVYLQGEPTHWIYFLKEGLIKLSFITEDGKTATVALMKPGEIFGELDLVDRADAQTQAVALEDSYLCRISRESFMEMVKSRQDMMLSVNKLLGLRMRRVEAAIRDLLFLDVPSRIAKLLFGLAESDGQKVPNGTRIRIRLTHQEIGHLIGATREMVTTVLGRFENDSLVIQDRRRLILPEPERLRKVFEK